MDHHKIDTLIQKLKDFSTPELCDGAGFYHSMDYRIKPQFGSPQIVGTAVTVDVPSGESSIIADAILVCQPGEILVVAGKGNCQCAYWGDHRSLCAKLRGAAGVVIDGAFRDYEGCEEIGFPIYARALTCGAAGKSGAGSINVPVSCGGVTVNPGDLIVGDRNGVCVLRPEQAEEVMKKALEKRIAQEETVRQMRQSGTILPRIKKSALRSEN